MTAAEALSLINTNAINDNTGVAKWADLGCGDGLFTFALSRMLAAGSIICGIDIVTTLKRQITSNGVEIIPMGNDFTKDNLGLQQLDGVLMANSLHYVSDKRIFISKLQAYLKPAAVFLVVEYDTDIPVSRWVPYPVSFLSLSKLFKEMGYTEIQKLNERPSVYGRRTMYSAQISK
jgi:SAM-dependent methyltransferase